jgi:SAM-dependent MidA family methyltransferase
VTALAARIAGFVRAHGPIDIGRFVLLCAAHRGQGYYSRGPGFGAEGDFVTAPEISQLFGELLGIACIAHWRACGAPAAFRIAELGPGNGTLLADLWRALAVDPACRTAVRSVELVEASAALRERQRARLWGLPLAFHAAVDSLPADLPLFVVANEFFDALPLRQFVRTRTGFRERLVTLDGAGRLAFALSPQEIPAAAFDDPRYRTLPEGMVVEIAPAREAVAATLAGLLRAAGGLAYVIDYGYDDVPAGDTLQAVRRHERVAPLETPGEADISAHVDFRALLQAAAAEGAATFGPVAQGRFLERLGIHLRLERLLRDADPEMARRLEAGVRRLVDPAAMGELFRVAAIAGTTDSVPPGFLEAERRS